MRHGLAERQVEDVLRQYHFAAISRATVNGSLRRAG